MDLELTVTGMSCDNCVRHVRSDVGAVAGVSAVDVDLATGRVVVHGEGFDVDAVREAVREAGYEVASG